MLFSISSERKKGNIARYVFFFFNKNIVLKLFFFFNEEYTNVGV